MVNIEKIPKISTILVYVLTWLYCYLIFKKSFVITLQKFIIAITICGFLEVFIACFFIPFQNNADSRILAFAASVILLVVACGVVTIVSRVGSVLDYKNDKKLLYYTVIYTSVVAAIIVDYNRKGTHLGIYVVWILACILVAYIFQLRLSRTKAEMEIKDLEIELHNIYGSAYSELLDRVRRRQHDFNNQLSAIYSMHITATSLDELVERQRQYMDRLSEDCRYDSILTRCENPILAGYLYNRCLACENFGIDVDYDISIEQANSPLPLHQLVELLGIFFDNACESLVDSKLQPTVIKFALLEDTEKIVLSVANPSRYMKNAEIEKMFLSGVSTKGKDRGLGLARAKEIVKCYDSEIKVTNCEEENVNWLRFEIEILK